MGSTPIARSNLPVGAYTAPQRVDGEHAIDPGIPHRDTLAKCAVAFSRISTSIPSRAFSARSRDSSICSRVTGLSPFAPGFPAWLTLRQFDKVCSEMPSSRAVWHGFLDAAYLCYIALTM